MRAQYCWMIIGIAPSSREARLPNARGILYVVAVESADTKDVRLSAGTFDGGVRIVYETNGLLVCRNEFGLSRAFPYHRTWKCNSRVRLSLSIFIPLFTPVDGRYAGSGELAYLRGFRLTVECSTVRFCSNQISRPIS